MKQNIDLKNLDFSFLGKGSKINGVFHLVGATHLASDLEGELHIDDDSNLCIEASGRFKGTINCHNIEIYGQVEGELKATGKVIVYPPATFKGSISAETLVIYPGAEVNMEGHTHH